MDQGSGEEITPMQVSFDDVEQHEQIPPTTSNDSNRVGESQEEEGDTSSSPQALIPLSKSSRVKGYITMTFLSCLAFVSAYESDRESVFNPNAKLEFPDLSFVRDSVVPSSDRGRYHAMIWSGISAILNFIVVMMHFLDSIVEVKMLRRKFQPKSEVECIFISFMITWWIIGTWSITSAHGIAGVGRGQFNLYFSVWLCCITSITMLEKWLICAKYASIYQAVETWPHRAPGWIMIFIFTLCNVLSIINLYLSYENVKVLSGYILKDKFSNIRQAQWIFLIFACGLSLTMAFGFSLAELCRREQYYGIRQSYESGSVRASIDAYTRNTRVNFKSTFELSLEGICLAILVLIWVPFVVVGTTDGCCSEVGNSYFFTWLSAYSIISTFIQWLRDWRRGIHENLLRQDREYREAQANVESIGVHETRIEDDDDRESEPHEGQDIVFDT